MQFTFFLQLALIIVCAQVCGLLAERLGQSKVIGEIAAGVLLGPSLFGQISPAAYEFIFSADYAKAMSLFSEIGLVLLMFQIGLEFELSHLKDKTNRKASVAVALAGLALPFALGCAIAAFSLHYLQPSARASSYILFCGLALSITAVPVMSRIILDLGIGGLKASSIALTSAALTDVAGWVLLAVVVQLASTTFAWTALAVRLGLVAAYCLVCWFVLRPALRAFIAWTAKSNVLGALTVNAAVLACVLLSAWATSMLGLHSAFGALMAGLLLRDDEHFARRWNETVGGFVSLALVPVFFAYAGCHANMGALESARFLPWFLLFFAAAVAGKFGGCYVSARLCGVEHRQARVISVLMNTRGLMELIVLTIGLDLGILPPAVYTMLVLMAIATTLMTVPMLRLWLPVRLVPGRAQANARAAVAQSSVEAR